MSKYFTALSVVPKKTKPLFIHYYFFNLEVVLFGVFIDKEKAMCGVQTEYLIPALERLQSFRLKQGIPLLSAHLSEK